MGTRYRTGFTRRFFSGRANLREAHYRSPRNLFGISSIAARAGTGFEDLFSVSSGAPGIAHHRGGAVKSLGHSSADRAQGTRAFPRNWKTFFLITRGGRGPKIAASLKSKERLEFWPVDRLIPSARNARTHSESQIAEIAGSIRAFGFANPILVGEGGDVIAGHGRLAAARQLGLTDVPVIPLKGLTELQRRQLVLADNRIALNAGWDLEMLHLELKDLTALGADLSLVGFTAHELAAALAPGVPRDSRMKTRSLSSPRPPLAKLAIRGAWDCTGLRAATAPLRMLFMHCWAPPHHT
jgi:ParB-like nuclease domain